MDTDRLFLGIEVDASAAECAALDASGGHGERKAVRAIGVSAQGPTLFLVIEAGLPIRPAIWLDGRADAQSAALRKHREGRLPHHPPTGSTRS